MSNIVITIGAIALLISYTTYSLADELYRDSDGAVFSMTASDAKLCTVYRGFVSKGRRTYNRVFKLVVKNLKKKGLFTVQKLVNKSLKEDPSNIAKYGYVQEIYDKSLTVESLQCTWGDPKMVNMSEYKYGGDMVWYYSHDRWFYISRDGNFVTGFKVAKSKYTK